VNKKLLFYIFLLNLVKLNNNPGLYKKFMNVNVSLIGLILLIGSMMFAACFSRVQGIGMMEEEPNQTTTNQEETFKQNQVKCLNLDDGWWSPIAGPLVVKACGLEPTPSTLSDREGSKTSTPITTQTIGAAEGVLREGIDLTTPEVEKEVAKEVAKVVESTTSPEVTETKDKEGNSILTLPNKDGTLTTIVPKESSQNELGNNMGLVEGVQKGLVDAKEQEKKDYDKGFLKGVNLAMGIRNNLPGEIKFERSMSLTGNLTSKNVEDLKDHFSELALGQSEYKSSAYRLGMIRGYQLGSEVIITFGY
jgi:hypothetical protein